MCSHGSPEIQIGDDCLFSDREGGKYFWFHYKVGVPNEAGSVSSAMDHPGYTPLDYSPNSSKMPVSTFQAFIDAGFPSRSEVEVALGCNLIGPLTETNLREYMAVTGGVINA